MRFAYEAMRPDGTSVSDVIEAGARNDAVEALREKGLLVMRLKEQREKAAKVGGGGFSIRLRSERLSARDQVLLTRQLKMLLESGSPLVPALEAAEVQTSRPHVRALLRRLRDRVEQGDTLTGAMEHEAKFFDPVFRGMVSAGEATGTLPSVFERLTRLSQRQLAARRMVTGSLIYPCVLFVLMIAVVAVLLFFVVPRFRVLFTTTQKSLPETTMLLFNLSESLRAIWPYVVGAVLLAIVAVVLCLRTPSIRGRLDYLVLRLPVVGRVVARLILARVVRIWAAMLRSHVPLIESIHKSREAITNRAFLQMITAVEDDVSSGGRVGQAVANVGMADPIITSAIRTGEENGRLTEAVDFVSDWLDEDNATLIQNATRMMEPVMLAFMGLVVGFVALALFIPLFDMATAA